MEKWLLGVDPVTGQRSEMCFEDDLLVTRETLPAAANQAILNSAASCRSGETAPKLFGGFGGLAARVPVTIRNNWRQEWEKKHRQGGGGMKWQHFLTMKINSTDYKLLRAQDKLL